MVYRNILERLPDDGRRGARLEIDEFLLDNEMTNLFLIALENLQQDSLTHVDKKPNWTNFYGIAEIHGEPIEKWDGITKGEDGYCSHGENTFPTWHRPYMFLIEQAIYREMKAQADLYDDEADRIVYEDAAARFRLPYWDLIMPRNKPSIQRYDLIWGAPQIFQVPEVWVKLPKKGWKQQHNPLFSFVFPKDDDYAASKRMSLATMAKSAGYYNLEETTRVRGLDGHSNLELFNRAIQRQGVARAAMIWQMLHPDYDAIQNGAKVKINEMKTWEQFANHDRLKTGDTMVGGAPYKVPSLESFHDGIHVLVGTSQYYDATGAGEIKDDDTGKILMPAIPGRLKIDDVRNPTSVRGRPSKAGQMGNPAFAAFDPIFFLHHCNIDRLLALYQAIYPEKYVAAGEIDADLKPFIASGETLETFKFWKSSDAYIRDYRYAGFAVPGNKPNEPAPDPTALRESVKQYLSTTYYWASNQQSHEKSLPSWPKDLSRSWALHGEPKETDGPAPVLQLSALKIDHGVPRLFQQEVQLPVATLDDNSTTSLAPPQVSESLIESVAVLASTGDVDAALPVGAFSHYEAATTAESVQITWNARVRVRKFAFNGSFSIHVFVGQAEEPGRYMTKKNEAGFTGVFARNLGEVSACSNCAAQQEQDLQYEDVIPLTAFLYDYLRFNTLSEGLITTGERRQLADLSPESVIPFLKEQISWTMIDLAANVLDGHEQAAGLEIAIFSRSFTAPMEGNLMGTYGPDTIHAEITNDKAGGLGYQYT